MSREYNLALTRLRSKLDRHAPRPVEVIEFMSAREGFGNPTNLSWQELQRLNAIDIISDAISHLRGWSMGMTVDVHERVCLLNVYCCDHITNGLLQQLLTRFPRAIRNRYLGVYGDQVRGAKWNNLDVDEYDSDEVLYNGDSIQEAAHRIEQFVENAEAAN